MGSEVNERICDKNSLVARKAYSDRKNYDNSFSNRTIVGKIHIWSHRLSPSTINTCSVKHSPSNITNPYKTS